MWEGLFIDVNGHNLSKTLTIRNMDNMLRFWMPKNNLIAETNSK